MAKRTSFLGYLLILGLTKVCLSDDIQEVKLEQGIVIGKAEKTLFKSEDYLAFRGVPYAAAPIGKLRFKVK